MSKPKNNQSLNPRINVAKESIRLDLWLWRARFFKSRTLAARFVSKGNLRLARMGQIHRVQKPHIKISAGDQLTFMIGQKLFQIEVNEIGTRRGPAREAQTLYMHLLSATSEPLTA